MIVRRHSRSDNRSGTADHRSGLTGIISSNRPWAMFLLYAATVIGLPAQNLTALHSFDGTDGANPYAGLVQATNGRLYGTTVGGGAFGGGTVFRITTGGKLTTLYSFCAQSGCTDGLNPYAGLVQATNGHFYGTTALGGANNRGTVFTITASGKLTTLHSFDGSDGSQPEGGLTQSANGDFYGTTAFGGANNDGTVFTITAEGKLTTVYSFNGIDGSQPRGGLTLAANGDLCGTTWAGGTSNGGTIFCLTPNHPITPLYSFPDSAHPVALIQATDGDFYGATYDGGASGAGTVFKITPSGTLTVVYSFCAQAGCPDGKNPDGGFIQATNGDFYGTTWAGGANNGGTIFQITPSFKFTTTSLCAQSACPVGEHPVGLVQDTNGDFYGTAYSGGANSDGTVFSLSVGLSPFV